MKMLFSSSQSSIFSDELCDALRTGKAPLPKLGVEAVKTADTEDATLQLVRAISTGRIPMRKMHEAIRLIPAFEKELLQRSSELLADAIWFVWLEISETVGDAVIVNAKKTLIEMSKLALSKSLINKEMLMEICEGDFMEEIEFVVNYKDVWRRKEIRTNTRAVYTQRKFNLLREESEGWSKAVTLLNQSGGGKLEEHRIETALEELKAIIGYFDLDPNRVCSIWLDAFTSQPENEYFIKLSNAFSKEAIIQLLGFHFGRGSTPDGLYKIAAKLIAHGVVNLESIWPRLLPSDEDIDLIWKEGKSSIFDIVRNIGVISLATISGVEDVGQQGEQRVGSGPQAGLAGSRAGQTASALDLDGVKYAAMFCKRIIREDSNKLRLLAELIHIGAWEDARAMIKWLACLGIEEPAVFPIVGKALCKRLDMEMFPIYRKLFGEQLRDSSTLISLKYLEEKQPGSMGGVACTNGITLSPRVFEILKFIGIHLYHDVKVLTKISRVVKEIILRCPEGDSERDTAINILASHILPAQSLIASNPAMILEIWNALKLLSYNVRFSLYSDLQNLSKGKSISASLLSASSRLAETEVRRILRRVTAPANKREAKIKMRPLGRMLGKIAHANPFAVSEQVIRQVMGMPGMVLSISQALNYLTPMAFDVLTFCVIKKLASSNRKLKEDGVNLEEWFQWLSSFTGQLCRKHDEIEITALLQYLANQLKMGEGLDLLVLEDILSSMVGVAPVHEVSRDQLDALAGSELLKKHIFSQQMGVNVNLNDRLKTKNTDRLLKALHAGPTEDHLAIPLLILLAQQRRLVTLQSSSDHLKTITELFDRNQEVLVAYSEFLKKALTLEKYSEIIPTIKELNEEFGIEPEVIFDIHRPILKRNIKLLSIKGTSVSQGEQSAETDMEKKMDVENEEGEIGNVDADIGLNQQNLNNCHRMSEKKIISVGDMEDGEVPEERQQEEISSQNLEADSTKDTPNSVLLSWRTLVRQISTLIPQGQLCGMSEVLYLTFWALEFSDLYVPKKLYQKVILEAQNKAKVAREEISSLRREAQYHHGPAAPYPSYQSQRSPNALLADGSIEHLSKEAEVLEFISQTLPGNMDSQEKTNSIISNHLSQIQDQWLCNRTPKNESKAVQEFIQLCLLPRLLISPADAIYCARFLAASQPLSPPGFRLLVVLDRMFRNLGYLVRCSTAREAANIGIFFAEALDLVTTWRDPKIYAESCAGREGFKSYVKGAIVDIPYRRFLILCSNWQKSLTLEVFRTSLTSSDYIQIRNALLALNKMIGTYPATVEDANELLKCLEPISKNDPREDLKTLSRMYCTALQSQIRNFASKGGKMVETREEYAGLKPKPTKSIQDANDKSSESAEKQDAAAPSKKMVTSKKLQGSPSSRKPRAEAKLELHVGTGSSKPQIKESSDLTKMTNDHKDGNKENPPSPRKSKKAKDFKSNDMLKQDGIKEDKQSKKHSKIEYKSSLSANRSSDINLLPSKAIGDDDTKRPRMSKRRELPYENKTIGLSEEEVFKRKKNLERPEKQDSKRKKEQFPETGEGIQHKKLSGKDESNTYEQKTLVKEETKRSKLPMKRAQVELGHDKERKERSKRRKEESSGKQDKHRESSTRNKSRKKTEHHETRKKHRRKHESEEDKLTQVHESGFSGEGNNSGEQDRKRQKDSRRHVRRSRKHE